MSRPDSLAVWFIIAVMAFDVVLAMVLVIRRPEPPDPGNAVVDTHPDDTL